MNPANGSMMYKHSMSSENMSSQIGSLAKYEETKRAKDKDSKATAATKGKDKKPKTKKSGKTGANTNDDESTNTT